MYKQITVVYVTTISKCAILLSSFLNTCSKFFVQNFVAKITCDHYLQSSFHPTILMSDPWLKDTLLYLCHVVILKLTLYICFNITVMYVLTALLFHYVTYWLTQLRVLLLQTMNVSVLNAYLTEAEVIVFYMKHFLVK